MTMTDPSSSIYARLRTSEVLDIIITVSDHQPKCDDCRFFEEQAERSTALKVPFRHKCWKLRVPLEY
jgi:hypothetical protein